MSKEYTVVERLISAPLQVTMDENGEVWIDAVYPEDEGEPTALMRIDNEGVSRMEAFEILAQLIEDHKMLNWADEHWRDKVLIPRCTTAREAIKNAMNGDSPAAEAWSTR